MKTSTRATRALFAKHYLFGQLAPGELDELLAHARVERYRAGETIFLNQSEGRGMMAVLSGQVRISTMSSNGHELVLNTIDAGEVFGELALLDGKERTADAIAVAVSELLVLDRSDFIPFLEKRPALAMRLLAIIAGRLRQTTIQATDVALLGLEQRLAKQLLRLAGRHGRNSGRSVILQDKFTQRQLGQMVGASRESVNKQFAAWRSRGITRFDEGVITLLDPGALRALTGGD